MRREFHKSQLRECLQISEKVLYLHPLMSTTLSYY